MTEIEKNDLRCRGYSEEYITIRDRVERKWNQWEIDFYNNYFATSTHAVKLHKDCGGIM